MEDLFAVGIPDHLVEKTSSGTTFQLRTTRGTVGRRLIPGQDLRVNYHAYELSTPFPAGMSGGPVFAMSLATPALIGLVGVVLSSIESHTILWQAEESPTEKVEGRRVIEYGIAACLATSYDSPIQLANGLNLKTVVGPAQGSVAISE